MQAFGLTPPWPVTSVDFKPAEGRIDFKVDCTATRLPCPECGATEQLVHDWLAPFKRLGQTMRDHFDGILEHFRTGLSNGFVEAMNGLLKAAIARARGYATDQRPITMAYLTGGKLKHLPANPWIPLPVPTAK